MRLVVLCPAATVTGGPEALHQLVDSASRQGLDAVMVYLPGEYHTVPPAYAHYAIRTISEAEIYPTDVVVLPEVMAPDAPMYAYATTCVWWLSVDNAPPGSYNKGDLVLAQSEYAYRALRAQGRDPRFLGDWTDTSVFREQHLPREDRVVVNPAKGGFIRDRFAQLCPDIPLVEAKGLDRRGVAHLFATSKVFVDFGDQPGRDRMPREAAASGAVVFVRNAGAARFRQDYTMPEEFFFGVTDGDLVRLGEQLREVLRYEAGAHVAQTHYREHINHERVIFDRQVASFFQYLKEFVWHSAPAPM